jgi:SSS family solute:Na+ symporter
MTTTAGLYARAALPQLSNPVMAFPALAQGLLPPVARGLFFAAMTCSMTAALQSKLLLSALSIGKDGVGRWKNAGEDEQESLTRDSLWLSGALALTLAYAIPSVVGLWWAIGSTLIPGLLLPLLGVYFPRIRAKRRWALAASICGTLFSGAWLAAEQHLGRAPFDIEPMFPGLLLSSALWALSFLFP